MLLEPDTPSRLFPQVGAVGKPKGTETNRTLTAHGRANVEPKQARVALSIVQEVLAAAKGVNALVLFITVARSESTDF